jgi:alkylation response protein AidB-like acyl-CoA dehydrogenase
MLDSPSVESPSVLLGEDYPDIREAVRAICANYPGSYWREKERTEDYPEEFVQELTKSGFLGALIPEEYGGSGLPLRAACVILEEIHASGCNAGACHAQMYIMGTLLRHGSDEQKDRWLPGIADGSLRLQAFGVTEPTTGSDTTQIKTRAVRDGDDYVVHGQKVWISRSLKSDLMLLLARTTAPDQVKNRSDGLSVFMVDIRESLGKGMEIRRLDAAINHLTTEIFFDGLRIPAENLIGQQDRGFRHILDGMNAERILVAAECIGDSRYFIRRATDYANERIVFARPIGQNQGVQFPIARAYAEYRAADLMNRTAAALFDDGRPCGEEANLAKMMASEASFKAGDTAMQTFGGFSFSREYDIERKWRETRIMQIAPISTNLILSYIAQHVLGLPRSF